MDGSASFCFITESGARVSSKQESRRQVATAGKISVRTKVKRARLDGPAVEATQQTIPATPATEPSRSDPSPDPLTPAVSTSVGTKLTTTESPANLDTTPSRDPPSPETATVSPANPAPTPSRDPPSAATQPPEETTPSVSTPRQSSHKAESEIVLHSIDSSESDVECLDSEEDVNSTRSTGQTPELVTPPDHAAEQVRVCASLLNKIQDAITAHPDAARDSTRNAWLKTSTNLLQRSLPRTVIGVLGNTGVGKSSLLNALLNEASILPTSGSRGEFNDCVARDD